MPCLMTFYWTDTYRNPSYIVSCRLQHIRAQIRSLCKTTCLKHGCVVFMNTRLAYWLHDYDSIDPSIGDWLTAWSTDSLIGRLICCLSTVSQSSWLSVSPQVRLPGASPQLQLLSGPPRTQTGLLPLPRGPPGRSGDPVSNTTKTKPTTTRSPLLLNGSLGNRQQPWPAEVYRSEEPQAECLLIGIDNLSYFQKWPQNCTTVDMEEDFLLFFLRRHLPLALTPPSALPKTCVIHGLARCIQIQNRNNYLYAD